MLFYSVIYCFYLILLRFCTLMYTLPRVTQTYLLYLHTKPFYLFQEEINSWDHHLLITITTLTYFCNDTCDAFSGFLKRFLNYMSSIFQGCYSLVLYKKVGIGNGFKNYVNADTQTSKLWIKDLGRFFNSSPIFQYFVVSAILKNFK